MEQFYENLLQLPEGWSVTSVEQDNGKRRVTVWITYNLNYYRCPFENEDGTKCGEEAKLHAWRERDVQDLDTHQYETYLHIRYPRVLCPVHGVQKITPPFAAANSRFSNLFEERVAQKLHGSSVQSVVRELGLPWHVVQGIKDRAYKRGEARRKKRLAKAAAAQHTNQSLEPAIDLCIDEVSFSRHDCLTIITERQSGNVIGVLDGRDSGLLSAWFVSQKLFALSRVRSISIDMAPPYIKAIRDTFPNAADVICYDRFHVARMFGKAVDDVRRKESARLDKIYYDNPLTGMRFELLRNNRKADNRKSKRRKFKPITEMNLKTTKAWKLKELQAGLWDYAQEGRAQKAWENLLWRMSHSHIPEMKKLYKSIKRHLQGILNAIKLKASNALAEAKNSCIQRVKYVACGYRDKTRFIREIFFQFGGLDLAF